MSTVHIMCISGPLHLQMLLGRGASRNRKYGTGRESDIIAQHNWLEILGILHKAEMGKRHRVFFV